VEENSSQKKIRQTKEYVTNADKHKKGGKKMTFEERIKAIKFPSTTDKEKLNYWGLNDEERKALEQLKTEMFNEFQQRANKEEWTAKDIIIRYGSGTKTTSKADNLRLTIVRETSDLTNISEDTLNSGWNNSLYTQIKDYYTKIFDEEFKETNNLKGQLIVKELLEKVGIKNEWYSMPYGESRAIKYHHYTPVIAYAILPFAEFGVFIIKTKRKYMAHKVWKKDVSAFSVSRVELPEALTIIRQIKEGTKEIKAPKKTLDEIRQKILIDQI